MDMVEKILDIDVDFYVSVNFEGFRQVVDAIGGVEFDVPKTITTWNDDYQRNVTVEAGPQVLDGEQAEAVVRHRKTYSEADLQRVQVQQEFMKAAAKQLLQGKNILKIPELIRICYKYVNTDLRGRGYTKICRYRWGCGPGQPGDGDPARWDRG
ncbi:MAG: LCP family protein [Clostridia bacterium]